MVSIGIRRTNQTASVNSRGFRPQNEWGIKPNVFGLSEMSMSPNQIIHQSEPFLGETTYQ